jgi:catechol 2,3-dioxygenase
MSRGRVITDVGHVAIQVVDLEAAERFAVEDLGLHVTKRSQEGVWLTHDAGHHTVHYVRGTTNAIHHIGLVAADAEAVDEIRGRVDAAGLTALPDFDHGDELSNAFAFETPQGFVLEVYDRMARVEPPPASRVLRPRRLGHVTFFASDIHSLARTMVDVLDFRVSDRADDAIFVRCNVDHHGIGIFTGGDVLHHYAFEYPTIVELAALADGVDARGGSMLWGPMRHGMGRNIATYVREPSGLVVEFYADMEQIYDDETHEPGDWSFADHKWLSLWAAHEPVPGFTDFGLPAAGALV